MVSLGNQYAHSSLVTWLNSLRYDSKKRLWRFFPDMYGAEICEYTEACSYVLFVSAVARAYQPGCKA
jgi:predicted P-loop ATPase